jgi:hypothetical protein
MGIYWREKIINEFNRSIVVDTYINYIGKVGKSNWK